MKKLNVLLAVTDTLRAKYKNMVADHSQFYKNHQSAFLGVKNTYKEKDGCADDPSKRKYVKVVTTVKEKIDYFINESKDFVDALLSQEKTNAIGAAKAHLIVDGEDWGEFTSLELLRLKSLIESGDLGNLENMLSVIPVRSDAEIWSKTTAEEYEGREIWETPMTSGESRTSDKEEYILEDPNLATKALPAGYQPKTSVRTKIRVVGDYTTQDFSGAWSHRERAGTLKRRNDLILAVTTALKECNECTAVPSELTAEKIFGYIFYGKK